MFRPDQTSADLVTKTQWIHEWAHHLYYNGWDVVDASRGRPTYPANEHVITAIKQTIQKIEETRKAPYGTNPFGEQKYREAVATSLSREYGCAFNSDEIAFTPGGQFGLASVFFSIFQQHKSGVVVAPCPWYLNHKELAEMVRKMLGAETKTQFQPVELLKQEGFRLSRSAMEAALAECDEPSVFLFCNPNNPLGTVTRKQEWLDIVPVLEAYPDVPIMLDEAFAEIVFDEHYDNSLLHAAPHLKERTFLFRSGTKAIGFPGERLAVMTVPARYREEVIFLQSRWIGNPAISSQAGMAAAIAHATKESKVALSQYYRENAEYMFQELNRLGIVLNANCTPEGGFYLLVNLSGLLGNAVPEAAKAALGDRSTIENDHDLVMSLLFGLHQDEQQGFALVPGSCFGINPKAGIVRVSFSMERAFVEHTVERFRKILTASGLIKEAA